MPHRAFVFLFALASLVAADLLTPAPALAWGPGAHMVIGNWVLQNLGVLPLAVAAALLREPGQFLHGSLSADIFVGKGSKAKKKHSHNWESGFTLLEQAAGPRGQAYAYGYLAHLAADTVAHNVFVPRLMASAPGAGRLAHVYLESQADRMLEWDKTDALEVFRGRASRRTDAMLRRSLDKNPFVFGMQSGLYRGGIALSGSLVWRRSLRLAGTALRDLPPHPLLEELVVLSARAAFSVLLQSINSPVCELDPIGAKALAAKDTRPRSRRAANTKERPLPAAPLSTAELPEALSRLPRICATFNPPRL